MKILVSDPVFVDDLVRFLHGRQCSAEQIGARAIDARPPESSQDAAYLRKELKAYLRTRVSASICSSRRRLRVKREARSTLLRTVVLTFPVVLAPNADVWSTRC